MEGYSTYSPPSYLVRSPGDDFCKHAWVLAGATTATDGWRCTKCGRKVETPADNGPPE